MGKSTESLPVLSILKQAFEIPAQSPGLYITALFISGLSMVILDLILSFLFDESSGFVSAVYFFLSSVLFTLFAITCHRLILLGANSVPSYGVLSWSKREWRFLGWAFVSYVLVFAGVMIGGIPFFILTLILDINSDFSVILIYLAVIPGLYYFSRICVLFPGCAIGEDMSIRKAMDMTENNGWRLCLVVLGVPMVFTFFFGWINGYFWFLDILLAILAVIVLLYEISVLSLSFQFLRKQRESAEENNNRT